MGPVSTFARALDRDSELASLVDRLIVVGGCWHEPGDASRRGRISFLLRSRLRPSGAAAAAPRSPFASGCDAQTALFADRIVALPGAESRTNRFLRQIVPQGITGAASLYGVEGFYLQDVLGLIPLVLPAL